MLFKFSNKLPHEGYKQIIPLRDGDISGMLEFGLVFLRPGERYENALPFERIYLLMRGTAEFSWDGGSARAERVSSVLDLPSSLHAPAGANVVITAVEKETELAVFMVKNDTAFKTRYYASLDVRTARLSAGKAKSETERQIRTVVDTESEPASQMTGGEILNYPGKWSSYPPHHHPHPEIYHYRFEPENGFGYAEEGDDVYKVRHRDTLLVAPHLPHPQVAAPGYAMVYVWAMPHLPGDRFGAASRKFEAEHEWVL